MAKREIIVSGFALCGTLAGYYLAKAKGGDRTPAMLLGGFLGGSLGEIASGKTEGKP